MKTLSSKLLALAAGVIGANAIADDSTCVWNKSAFACEPKKLCKIQLKLGDHNLDQSCRVKPGVNLYPQQIHLAFAGTTAGTGMTVSWATFEEVNDSAVWVGSSEDTLKLVNASVTSVSYYCDGPYRLTHHHATIPGLTPRTKYFYKVGSKAKT